MAELDDLLSKQERLKKMELYGVIVIEKEKAQNWRTERHRYYRRNGKVQIFKVRTAEDGITRVIRTE